MKSDSLTGGSYAVVLGIVTKNRADTLRKAISSGLEQNQTSMRVTVLNDGSTDSTAGLAKDFPSVDWITWPESKGYMLARNYLMETASEEFFVGLDDDAWFLRGDEVNRALNHLAANPQVAAVAFDILSPDKPTPQERRAPREAAMFIGCGHVLRLACVREVGFYDASPGLYGGEEKDLCLRLLDKAYRIDRLPGVHVWHEKSSLARDASAQHRSGVCNDLAMTLRRAPLLFVPAGLLMKTAQHFAFSCRNRLIGPCLEGMRLFLRSGAIILRKRRPVKLATLRTFMRLSRGNARNDVGLSL